MNTRKTQNSILFLTTLGVYLGLLVAGGAVPQVFAHSATTRNFELTDEIEIRDDLEKKPGGCDLSALIAKVSDYETKFLWFNSVSIPEFAHLVEHILDAYTEKVDGIDVSWRSIGDDRPSRKVMGVITYPFGFLDTETSDDLDRDILFVGNGLPGKAFTFSVQRNNFETQFRFESQRIPYDAPLVRALYSTALDRWKCGPYCSLESEKIILRNTELSVEGDHLVIITRLPRGSLDSLHAKEAK
ncbi:MAG: hypothetical protein ACRD6X_14420 [Pyrinomonadaceae bacterium]